MRFQFLFVVFTAWSIFSFSIECKAFQFIEAEDLLKSSQINLREIGLKFKGKTLPEWMLSNIQNEVSQFSSYTTEEFEEFYSKAWQTLFHFRIRGGKLYVRCNENGLFPPMTEYAGAILLLLKQPGCQLKSGDFLLDFADTVAKNVTTFPILCFSKDPDSNYIMVPDGFAIWKEKIQLMREIDKANSLYPWENKIEKGFWIGSVNGLYFNEPMLWKTNQRSEIVLFSLEHPDLVFAKFSSFINEDRVCDEMKNRHHELHSQRIPQAESCKFKYQIDVEGWSCGFHRTQWVLRSNCVSIKQRGPNTQWFYNGLKPYVHYVPYEADCSDLKNAIEWLRQNDDKAKEIALQGRQFALDYLNTEITYLYLYTVLLELNKLNRSL